MKRWIAAVFAAILVMTSGTAASAAVLAGTVPSKAVSVMVNGERLQSGTDPFIQSGRVLAPVKETFEGLGLKVEYSPDAKRASITDGNTVLLMSAGSRVTRVNAKLKLTDVAPVLQGDTLFVPVGYVAGVFETPVQWDNVQKTVFIGQYVPAPEAPSAEPPSPILKPTTGKRTVVIDAGHGGKDPGAVYFAVKEKDLNLDIALRLKKLLQKEGVNVQMTRETDVFHSLYSRSALANNVKADLLVSIHNNASTSRYTTGAMTLYHPGTANANGNLTAKSLAKTIQSQLAGDLKARNLGIIERTNLAILRTANMPAVIVEVGFMSNLTEVNRLKKADYRQKAAESLKTSIMKALGDI